MKKRLLSLVPALALALPLLAQNREADRVRNAGMVMREILNAPDSIPQSVLDRADCIAILPSVLKLAFGIGGSFGRGVMTCRSGSDFQGPWGAPTMMRLGGGSIGLQLGGQATDFVLLLMSPRSAQSMLRSRVKLGADVSAAAGPVGRTAAAATDITLRAEILSYSRSRGLFGGVSLAGSTLRADNGANRNLYGKDVRAQDIVFNNAVPVPDSAKDLLATLQKASPVNKSK
jgi:lipid-binding SYLF domain-containing protein